SKQIPTALSQKIVIQQTVATDDFLILYLCRNVISLATGYVCQSAARVDLDGNAVGEVTVDQATGAQWLLLNVFRPRQEQWLAENAQQLQQQRQERPPLDLPRAKERRKVRKQQKRAAAAAKAAAEEAAKPKRLSLEGLRQAAVERRAAAR